MIRVKTSFLVLVSLFGLIACSQRLIASISIETPTSVSAVAASATPYVAGTETALAGPTPWIGGTETALAVSAAETQSQNAFPTLPPPTSVPTFIEKPTDFSPVLYGGKFYQTSLFLLLGGVSRDAWLIPDISVSRFSGEVTYSLHTLTQEAKYFVWGNTPAFSPICKTYSVGTEADLDEAGFVAVVDGWNITKRPVTELSAGGQFYEQAVIDWLREEGVTTPQLDSLRAYKVDLEGDGTDEVFISATHLDDSQHTTKAGDYSVILMRQVIGNDAVTKLIVGDVYRSQDLEITYPRTYSLTNFIDLNQDGSLEVVVEIQKWEGFGAGVFQIDREDVIQVLGAEC